MHMHYINFTNAFICCYDDLTETPPLASTTATICATLLADPQPSQSVCAATSTATHIASTPESQHVTETPNASPQSCANLLPSSTSGNSNMSQTGGPIIITPGYAVAIAMGAVLIIETVACTVAWVVCLKRKEGKRRGRLCE